MDDDIRQLNEDGLLVVMAAVDPTCDFCSRAKPIWKYPAHSFVIEEANWTSRGSWHACQDCADKIDSKNYDALVQQAVALVDPDPSGMEKADLFFRIMVYKFVNARNGDPVKL